jgi:N-6 DNA Methylase
MTAEILDYSRDNGLVLCDHVNDPKNNAERLYIAEIQKLKAYAVLFRRFYNPENRQVPYHSEPAVCIFKESDFPFNSPENLNLHAALWSAGKNEVYIILGKTRVDIINARRPAEESSNATLTLESLKLADLPVREKDPRFSAKVFTTGTFWEQEEFAEKLDENSTPYIHLVNYLMAVRRVLLTNSEAISLSDGSIDKLLILTILVKFLEEVKDDDGKHTLRSIYRNIKVTNFSVAIQKGLIFNVFDQLSEEFNGKIFDRFSSSERRQIESADLSLLSQFLEANIDLQTKQFFLWNQYSFNHLPAEVISAIYENFIQADAKRTNGKNEKGVVYTPLHLVNFLVDEVMPLEKPELFSNESFKVLDPTCGSGVFLVAAYKRLLQWWAINNSKRGQIEYPSSKIAQKILADNIFGVDVKETAILVSILGLTTALLDKLSPKEIWNRLRFTDLNENNLIKKSFFKWAYEAKVEEIHFDLVIGNPPFNPESGTSKDEVLNETTIAKLGLKHSKLPGRNFALHFFEAAMVLGREVCMIIPSNILLYNKAAYRYRAQIFKDYTVRHIYDFTHLRRNLFHRSADTPVVGLIVKNQRSEGKPILHTVVKRMIQAERRLRFEIDYYDTHSVPFDYAIDKTKQPIWKTNLLGGGRLFHLVSRLSKEVSFKQFILNKKASNREWTYSVGYKLEGNRKKKNVRYLLGKESIITETFDEDETFDTFIEYNKDFAEPRDQKIYEPPHLIFKVNIGSNHIPVHFSEKYLCFKDKLVGIHAPLSEKKVLRDIYDRFKEEKFAALTKFWVLATSAESLVNLETACKKEDIDSLPYPIEVDNYLLSKAEEALVSDVLNYYVHLGKTIRGDNPGAALNTKASNSQLLEYGRFLCEVLNEIYEKKNKCWQLGSIYESQQGTICQIGYGSKGDLQSKNLSELDQRLVELLNNSLTSSVAFRRVFRIYKNVDSLDCIYLVKPPAFRYWTKSIALRDADDTFLDLKKEGY